jgi:hypothetical protein
MEKTNWKRVFIGGITAGVVYLILLSALTPVGLIIKKPVLESFSKTIPTQFTAGDIAYGIIACVITGILAVWLYSAIRPRYGAGPKTALIAGIFIWFIGVLITSGDALSAVAYVPIKVFLLENLIIKLIPIIVATLLGAWLYKEKQG